MSQAADHPAPDQHLAIELLPTAVNGAFAEAARAMREHGLSEEAITHEFMAHAIDRLMVGMTDIDLVRGKAHRLVSDFVDSVSAIMDAAEPAPAAPDAPTLDPEVALVTRLALDMSLADFKVNNGFARMKGDYVVTQAIGLLGEAKRQVAAVRSGETVIVEKPAPTDTAAA